MKLECIPPSLRQLTRWIWWDKQKKPHSAATGELIDPTNPKCGVPYEDAVDYMLLELSACGLGFMLGDGIAGVDIDGAFDEAGCLHSDAREIVELMKPCYMERSPSGNGIHILGFGVKSRMACKKPLPVSKMLEVYDKGRYFTVTGDRLPESAADLTDLTPHLAALGEKYFPAANHNKPSSALSEGVWSDREVLDSIRQSPSHAFIFEDLWNGDLARYNGDHSSADAALIERLLFFSGGNEPQVDRLFRQSGLMREKWDEMRGSKTYGDLTIGRLKQQMTNFRAKPRPLTEVGAAERLADRHGDTLRYCHDWGRWLLWDGARWDTDKTNRVQSMAVQVVRSIPQEADAMDEKTQKAYVNFSRGLEKNSVIGNVLRQAERLMPVLSGSFDADLWKLNCLNGTLDLTTGKLFPPDPAALHTQQTPVLFDPKASCPRYEAFLRTALCGNEELFEFVRQYTGITLTGSIAEQCFAVLFGQGDNGKSVQLNILRALMGEYGKTAPPGVFLEKKHGDGIPNDLADLQGARFVVDIETKEKVYFNEQRIKAVTGGEPIKARFLNKEFFEFTPQLKLWIASNHKPNISGMDAGIWRRIRIIPFDAVIPKEQKVKDLDKIIAREELPGILNWALRGCLDWQKAGALFTPQAVMLATESYKQEMDILGQFIEDCCEVGDGFAVMKAELYQAYHSWAISSGHKYPLTATRFGSKMKERNRFNECKHREMNGRYSWEGIRLKVTADFL